MLFREHSPGRCVFCCCPARMKEHNASLLSPYCVTCTTNRHPLGHRSKIPDEGEKRGGGSRDREHLCSVGISLECSFIGWAAFLLLGKQLLPYLFTTASADIYRATLVMLAGSAGAAALEPIARMQMGLGRLRRLFFVRAVALCVTIAAIILLVHWSPLDRFAAAC